MTLDKGVTLDLIFFRGPERQFYTNIETNRALFNLSFPPPIKVISDRKQKISLIVLSHNLNIFFFYCFPCFFLFVFFLQTANLVIPVWIFN